MGINDTGVSEDSPHVFIIALRTLFLILCTFLTIGGNILSILVLNRLESMSEVPKIFLLSLAFTDLCMGLSTDLFSIIPAIISSWPYGDVFCKVIGNSGSFFCGVSLLSLVSVSVDRYIAISKPLHYIRLVTRPRALCVVITIWIFTSVFVILSSVLKGDSSVIYNPRLCTCMVPWGDTEFKIFNLTVLFAFIMVPAIGMLLIYIRLFLISRRHIRKIADESISNTGNPPVISRQERKAIKTLFIVTGAFNAAWLPFLIYHSYLAISGKVIDGRLLFFIVWLAISNSWWNVLIYSVTNRAFRNTASAFLKSLLPASRNAVQRFNGD